MKSSKFYNTFQFRLTLTLVFSIISTSILVPLSVIPYTTTRDTQDHRQYVSGQINTLSVQVEATAGQSDWVLDTMKQMQMEEPNLLALCVTMPIHHLNGGQSRQLVYVGRKDLCLQVPTRSAIWVKDNYILASKIVHSIVDPSAKATILVIYSLQSSNEFQSALSGRLLFSVVLSVLIMLAVGLFVGRVFGRNAQSMARGIIGAKEALKRRDSYVPTRSRYSSFLGAEFCQIQKAFDEVATELSGKIRELYGVTERKARYLRNANRQLQNFNYSISHDVKDRIKGIQARLYMMRLESGENFEHLTARDLRRDLSCIESELSATLNMLATLKHMSEEPDFDAALHVCNLREVCETIVLPMTESHKTVVNLEADDVDIIANRALLHAVLQNLISNAVKYKKYEMMEANIEVSADRYEADTIITVRDFGRGFDARWYDAMFIAMHRPHRTIEKDDSVEGHGLGLLLVRQNVTAMGGDVWATYDGESTRFSFYLPNKEI